MLSLNKTKEMPSVCTTGGISLFLGVSDKQAWRRGESLRGPGPYAPQRSRHAQNESASGLNDHPAVVTVPDDRAPEAVLGAAHLAVPSHLHRPIESRLTFHQETLTKAISVRYP